MTTRQIVLNYLKHFSAGDIDGLQPLLAPDLRFRGPLHRFDSRDAYLETLRLDPPVPTECEVREILGDDDGIACFYVYGPGRVEVAQLFRFRDGRISETRLFFDPSRLARD